MEEDVTTTQAPAENAGAVVTEQPSEEEVAFEAAFDKLASLSVHLFRTAVLAVLKKYAGNALDHVEEILKTAEAQERGPEPVSREYASTPDGRTDR